MNCRAKKPPLAWGSPFAGFIEEHKYNTATNLRTPHPWSKNPQTMFPPGIAHRFPDRFPPRCG
jgi:hypothetical protein